MGNQINILYTHKFNKYVCTIIYSKIICERSGKKDQELNIFECWNQLLTKKLNHLKIRQKIKVFTK